MASTDNPGYPWKQTYVVEQKSLEEILAACKKARKEVARVLKGCNAMAPDSGLKICLRPFSSGETFCQRLYGHPGGHSRKPECCNRPAGHEGPHAFIVSKDARKLGEWTT